MQLPEKSTEFDDGQIALEMLMLLAHAVLLGIAVAVVVAVPIVLLAISVP